LSRYLLGVFYGEFGWEIAHYQAALRKKSREFDKTFIITHPNHHYLYDDFAEPVNFGKELPHCNVIFPWKKDQVFKPKDQEFRKFSEKPLYNFDCNANIDFYPDIVIHARDCNISFKNWSKDNWMQVLSHFSRLKIKIVMIGSKGKCLDFSDLRKTFNNIKDYTNASLCTAVKLISNAKLFIGPNSGPTHLAQHCGTHTLTWTDNKIYMGHNTVRQRLENTWNPFKAKTTILDDCNWQPEPEKVIREVRRILNKKP